MTDAKTSTNEPEVREGRRTALWGGVFVVSLAGAFWANVGNIQERTRDGLEQVVAAFSPDLSLSRDSGPD